MVSQYRLISGLGTLYALPLEIRHRIYQMYFCRRVVSEYDGEYSPEYHRDLLLVSKAVYNEAAPREKACGIILTLDATARWPLPTKIRDAVEEVQIGMVDDTIDSSELDFNSNDFPVLKTVRDSSNFLGPEISHICLTATVDDAFNGRMDHIFIKYVQNARRRYQDLGLFDWDKLPVSVRFVLHLRVSFPSQKKDSKGKMIDPKIEKKDQQWRVIKRAGVKGEFAITIDEYGRAVYS